MCVITLVATVSNRKKKKFMSRNTVGQKKECKNSTMRGL